MNNLSNSQFPTLKENQEVFSFETMKGEFISIIDGLLKAYETSLNSDGIPETEKKDEYFTKINTIFLTKISTLINGFISEYQEYFNIDLFRNIFGPYGLSSYENQDIIKINIQLIRNIISHRIAIQKDNEGPCINDHYGGLSYNIQQEKSKCGGEIDKLLSYDENLLGYVIFEIFKQKVGELKDLESLLYWVEILQNTNIFSDTITRVEINNFLFRYREQLNTEMLFGLLGSGRGEDTLKSILDNSKNTQTKMDVCIFVMKHHEERYRLYMPKIFEACMSCMKDKIGTSYGTGKGCDIQDLRKIYKYYKENKAIINPDLDIDGAFEIYSELFVSEDFNDDLNGLHCGDLPVSYVKMAFSGFVKKILKIKNTIDVEAGLFDDGIINVLLSNIDHGLHGLPGFSEKIELSNNEIKELKVLGYDSQDGLEMPDYIKRYTLLIRKNLYYELNLRIYGDNEKIREGLTKKYIKVKKELDSMMSKILGFPEEKEFNNNNNNSGGDIEPNNGEE